MRTPMRMNRVVLLFSSRRETAVCRVVCLRSAVSYHEKWQ